MALPILKVLLAAIDIAVLALVVALLLTNRKSQRHDVRSWATAFQVLVLTWLILRGVFWVLTITAGDTWEANVFYLLYWLPNPLQFGSFLILPLFYSQVLSSKREWKARSRVIGPIYISLVGGMIMFMVLGALVKAIDERKGFECVSSAPSSRHPRQRCYRMEFTNEAFRIITVLCFFGLAVVVAAFGVRMSKLTTPQNRLYSIFQPRALKTLNWFLCVVFLSKGAYQMSVILKLWYLPDLPLQGTEDVCFLNFVVFVVWDYAPPLWLLLTMTTSVSVKRGGHAGSAVVKAGFHPRTSSAGDVRNLPDYGLFREIKAAAFAAEEVARLEAQSRFGSCSFETALQYSPSPRSSSSPMANTNSWFREGDNNPEGTKISPFGSSLGSSFGSTSMHSITVCPGSLASSTESSLGGVGFAASPNAPPDSAPHVTGVWSRAASSQKQSASAEMEGVGRVCGGGGGGGDSSGGRFQGDGGQIHRVQQQQQHREQFERDEIKQRKDSYNKWLQQQQYQQYRQHHQPRHHQSHHQSSSLAVGSAAKYAKNGSGGGEVESKIAAVGEGGAGLFGGSNGRGGGRSGVDGVGRTAEISDWWTKLVGGWGEKKKKTRGPKIPVKHFDATGEGASNEASRLMGTAVMSSPPTWGSMEFSLESGGHSLGGRGAADAADASGGPLPSVGRREQADAVGRSEDGPTNVGGGSQRNPRGNVSTSSSSGGVPPQQQQQHRKKLQRNSGGSGHVYVTVAHTIAPGNKVAGGNSGNGDSISG